MHTLANSSPSFNQLRAIAEDEHSHQGSDPSSDSNTLIPDSDESSGGPDSDESLVNSVQPHELEPPILQPPAFRPPAFGEVSHWDVLYNRHVALTIGRPRARRGRYRAWSLTGFEDLTETPSLGQPSRERTLSDPDIYGIDGDFSDESSEGLRTPSPFEPWHPGDRVGAHVREIRQPQRNNMSCFRARIGRERNRPLPMDEMRRNLVNHGRSDSRPPAPLETPMTGWVGHGFVRARNFYGDIWAHPRCDIHGEDGVKYTAFSDHATMGINILHLRLGQRVSFRRVAVCIPQQFRGNVIENWIHYHAVRDVRVLDDEL